MFFSESKIRRRKRATCYFKVSETLESDETLHEVGYDMGKWKTQKDNSIIDVLKHFYWKKCYPSCLRRKSTIA